jgi:hypothetical protein
MAISMIQAGGVVAIGHDSATGERGFMTKVINRTGHTSVKGELVALSTATDKEVILQANEYDTVGIVQEAGVAEGSEMWIWGDGSICQVLYKDSTASTRGNILIADAVDGRGSDIANPGTGLPAAETHFKECGHCLESKSAGTNVLALCRIHFL